MSASSRPTTKSSRRLLSSAEKERNRKAREERWRGIRESYHREHKEGDHSNSYHNFPSDNAQIRVFRQSVGRNTVNDITFKVLGGDPDSPELFERTVDNFRSAVGGMIAKEIHKVMTTAPQVKFQIRLQVEIRKYDERRDNVSHDEYIWLCSNTLPIQQASEVTAELDLAFQQIHEVLDQFNQNGSNWVIHRITQCDLKVDRWVVMRAGGSYIPLPDWLKSRNAIINIQNNDQLCFKYVVEAGYNTPKKNAQRVSNYKDLNTFKYKPADSSLVMTFPFNGQEKVLKEFERINSHLNVSINAYYVNAYAKHPEHITVLYRTNAQINSSTKCIDLLLIEDKDGNRHWTLIKNFDRLFSLSRHDLSICRRCLLRMKRSSLDRHMEECDGHAACKVELPQPMAAFAGFTKYKKMLPAPFVIYADFEAIATKEKPNSVAEKDSFLRTHVPNAFCFYRVCNFDDNFNGKPVLYRANNMVVDENTGEISSGVGEKLIEELNNERGMIISILKKRLLEGSEMKLTEEDEEKFKNETQCHICKLPFEGGVHPSWNNIEVDSVKVRDHDHLSRKSDGSNYRGAAHAWCNLQFHINFKLVEDKGETVKEEKEERLDADCLYSDYDDDDGDGEKNNKRQRKDGKEYAYRQFNIPVVFHNLKGYDGHIILKAINSNNALQNIHSIPQNGEKFLSFGWNNIKFIDSLQFLNSSLSQLVDNIRKDDNGTGFPHLKSQLQWICNRFNITNPTPEHFQLLLTKGVYPYDYMDSFARFEEKELPPIEAFKSMLDGSDLDKDDYEHAKKIWKLFNIKNMGDYHDLYLLTDVLLLTDVFQRFRRDAINDTRLDPLHYLSLPGYSLDACYSQCAPVRARHNRHGDYCIEPFRVEVFNSSAGHKDMHLFCESAVRGGVSMITNRLANANHKGLKDYDPSKLSSYLMYLDANNLYGWAMSQYMPIGEYSWIKDVECFTTEYISNISDYADYGYLLEVDLDIPPELHDKFRSYPLAPESIPVQENEVSPFTQQLRSRLKVKHDNTPKLLCTLHNKVKYKVHYRNLKLYLSLGYKLKKVHRVLKFRQEPWIRSYIAQNTTKRAQALNDFLKDYFKLLNNAVFGKFLQDDRKHRNARILTKAELMERAIADPYYADRYMVGSDIIQDGIVTRPGTIIAYMNKRNITLDKPIIVGVCILELSKYHMYNFYYNVMQKIFTIDRLRLNMTDTDSLNMLIQSDDFYAEIVKNNAQGYFDWSNYPENHPMYNKSGKAVLGLFKDELAGYWMKQFVGLRAKLYSIEKDEKTMMGEVLKEGESIIKEKGKPDELFKKSKHLEKKTAKGVKKHIIKKKLRHSQYYDCLTNPDYDPRQHEENMIGFQTLRNQIYTVKVAKMTLSACDDKMYVMEDGVSTLPYGHRSILTIQSASASSSSSTN